MRKIKIKQRVSISGKYAWNDQEFPNVITDVGLTEIAKVLIGHGLPPAYIEGGYGSVSPAPVPPALTTDLDLSLPVPDSDITYEDTESSQQPLEYPRKKANTSRIEALGSPNPVPIPENQVMLRYSVLVGGDQGNTTGFPGAFEEVGVFDLPYRPVTRQGVLYSRALPVPVIQTRNNLGGTLQWTLTIDKGDVSANGGIVKDALDILANVLMRKKEDGLYSASVDQETVDRQRKAKYVDLFLNTIEVGTGDAATSEDMDRLDERIVEGNFNASSGNGRLTSVNITPASTSGGVEFPAVIRIQRAIRFGDVNEEIKEVGLFNIHTATIFTGTAVEKKLWGRHVLATPLPAGEEAVIQFDIEIGR